MSLTSTQSPRTQPHLAARQKSGLPSPPLIVDPQQRYSVREAAAILRVSLAGLYNDMAAGRLAYLQDGRRRFVLGAELIRRSQAAA